MNIKGAGIFIVENYKNTLVAVLFGKQGSKYSDTGGVIDNKETPEQCACRETREETANLLNISPHELKQISTSITFSSYKAYIIYVKNLSIMSYQHNIKKVLEECKKREWKENDSMVRIPLSLLMQVIDKGENTVNDLYKNKIQIKERTIHIVKRGKDILTSLYYQIPYNLYQSITLNHKMDCLIGTYTYTIQPEYVKVIKDTPQKREYPCAVYIIPNLKDKYKKINECNDTEGGLHIKLLGFSKIHPPLKTNLRYLSDVGKEPWRIDPSSFKIKNNTIFFCSGTLDQIANYLDNNSFQKIKGKRYSGTDWNISFNCVITDSIIKVLRRVTWSFIVIRDNKDGTYTWLFQNRYLVKNF